MPVLNRYAEASEKTGYYIRANVGGGNPVTLQVSDPDFLVSIIHAQFISNLVAQFKNLGILTPDTPVIEPKDALDPLNHYWHPRSFELG